MKKFLVRILTVLIIIGSGWFIWKWHQQNAKQNEPNPTDNEQLLSRCLDKAQKDYDRDVADADAAPAPNLAGIAAETYEKDKVICYDLYK